MANEREPVTILREADEELYAIFKPPLEPEHLFTATVSLGITDVAFSDGEVSHVSYSTEPSRQGIKGEELTQEFIRQSIEANRRLPEPRRLHLPKAWIPLAKAALKELESEK